MKKIKFIPLQGIEIDDSITIDLGTSRARLIELIGAPSKQFGNELYYDNLELHIDVDDEANVEFIESIMGPYPEKTEVSIGGVNPFKIKSEDLIDILTHLNKGKVDRSEAAYGYSFIDKAIGIYRGSTVEDIEEMIKEMRANDEFEEHKDNALYELEKSQFFWTIGIGKKRYYDYLIE